jgi:hypothetical protein
MTSPSAPLTKELKPCPFCGGEATFSCMGAHLVRCSSGVKPHCPASFGGVRVETWNRRESLAAQSLEAGEADKPDSGVPDCTGINYNDDSTAVDSRRTGTTPLTKDNLADFAAGKKIGGWKEGGISLEGHNGWFEVLVERNGEWVRVIRTYHGGITSHAVWPSGINAALASHLSGDL